MIGLALVVFTSSSCLLKVLMYEIEKGICCVRGGLRFLYVVVVKCFLLSLAHCGAIS